MRTALIAAAAAAVTACAPTRGAGDAPPPGDSAGRCQVEPARHLVGARATAATGSELLRLTGARTLRWVPPRTAVTMDFRPDRLTVSYDDDMVVTQISCT